jgi:hypothetical protein
LARGGNSRPLREWIAFLFQEAELKYLSIYVGLINFTPDLTSVISDLRSVFVDRKRILIKSENTDLN